jgi:hypothetical protein
MTIHTQHGIDIEELKYLIKGKIQWRKCPECDNNGLQYFDGSTGLGVAPYPLPGIPEEDLASENCDNCYGLAYILYYV